MEALVLRVFPRKSIYRRKGDVGGRPRGPHPTTARLEGGRAALGCGALLGRLRLSFGLRVRVGKIGGPVQVSSNSENIYRTAFLKYKKQQKTGTSTVASC